MLGPPKLRLLDQPVLVSLDALVPPDNFYRFLDQRLDLSFVRTWVQELYAAHGRPSIDPVVFFKLQLILFFEGLRSERKLMETVQLNLAHRWYLGYRFDQPLPHHSSLTRIRCRLGLPTFERFFAHVLELCQQAGLVWGAELLFDATKVRANADIDSLVPRWSAAAKAHLDELFTAAPDEPPAEAQDMTAPPATSGAAEPLPADLDAPQRLPFAGTTEAEQQVAAQNAAAWRLLDEHRLDPGRRQSSSSGRTTDLKVSTTDPDASPMRAHLGDRTKLGDHDHYVVDGGKSRISLAALVTPADVMENTPMQGVLRRVRFRWHLHPEQVVGDTTYGTMENIRALEDDGIRAYVPLADCQARSSFYGTSRFTYDAERDAYRCPQDQVLTRLAVKPSVEKVEYRASAAVCNACPAKAACTDSEHGRLVSRPFATPYLDRVRGYHATEADAKAMRKRQVWVEPLFAEAKQWHGLRQFRLRGLWKVNCEGLRIAAGQNLKRWLTRIGWGRRSGPAGSLALAIPATTRDCFRRRILRYY